MKLTKRPLLAAAFALLGVLASWAQTTINPADALALAKQVWPASRDGKSVNPELSYEAKNDSTDHPYYYIFNKGNNEGYVIISADSRNKKILGYSPKGHFDIATAPPEMKAWLGAYEEALDSLSLVPDSILKMNLKREHKMKVASRGVKLATSVAPLLGDIEYSQEYPYNARCPWSSVTGCVATGAVQIMRYHEWPKQPTNKSHSYNWQGYSIGTQFNTAYDWDNMLVTYPSGYTFSDASVDAISQLMYDAGVSCDMSYTQSSSGAFTEQMALSLNEYFDYDADMTLYERKYYSEDEFCYFLKRELSAGRPVLFSGHGDSGGHCFVCDGYDENGLFHFNWGWNGLSNGYFEISNLAPGQYSTGGGNGTYNQNVAFVGGIQPDQGRSVHNKLLGTWGNETATSHTTKGGSVNYQFQYLSNASMTTYTGKFGAILYKDGAPWKVLASKPVNLKRGYYFTGFSLSGVFPKDVPNGDYEVVYCGMADGDNTWRPVLAYRCNSQRCTVKGSEVTMDWNNDSRRLDIYFDERDVKSNERSEVKTIDIRHIGTGDIEKEVKAEEGDTDEDDDDIKLEDASSFYGI